MPSEQLIDAQRREFGLPLLAAPGSSGQAPPALVMDLSQGFRFGFTLAAACFIAEPINPTAPGELVVLSLTQGGSGSYAVTWAACFRNAPNWSGGGAVGTKATALFIYDGSSYQFIGGSPQFDVANTNVYVTSGGIAFQSDGAVVRTNPQPTAGSISLAGVAPTVTNRTIVTRGPTVGAVALAGVAPSLAVNTPLVPPTPNPNFSLALVGNAPVVTRSG